MDRFREEKQLASYVGLVPMVRDSGEVIHNGLITRKGNKIARTTLFQDDLVLLKQKTIKNEWEDTKQVIIDVLLNKLYNDDTLIENYKLKE